MKFLHFTCFCLAINLPCLAQTGNPEAAIPREAFVKSRFYDISDTKVRRTDGTKITGRLIFLDRNKVVVMRRNGRQVAIPVQGIEAIYIRERGVIGLGILTGLVTGAAIGYVAASTASDGSSPNNYFSGLPSYSGIGGAGVGAVVGAVAGGMIGGLRTRYEINGAPGKLSDLGLRLNLERK